MQNMNEAVPLRSTRNSMVRSVAALPLWLPYTRLPSGPPWGTTDEPAWAVSNASPTPVSVTAVAARTASIRRDVVPNDLNMGASEPARRGALRLESAEPRPN